MMMNSDDHAICKTSICIRDNLLSLCNFCLESHHIFFNLHKCCVQMMFELMMIQHLIKKRLIIFKHDDNIIYSKKVYSIFVMT